MFSLGIDPSLNAVGYATYPTGILSLPSWTNTPPSKMKNQTEKIFYQFELLLGFLEARVNLSANVSYVAIEQPFVLPMASRGRGGHQSSNMWAIYTMLLYACSKARLPVAIFHLSQLRSLIHGRGGTTKFDTIVKANDEGIDVKDDHQADAYFIAKYGYRFWNSIINKHREGLTEREINIFFDGENAMIKRPGIAFMNFACKNPLELPPQCL